jgi:hypothetical protein
MQHDHSTDRAVNRRTFVGAMGATGAGPRYRANSTWLIGIGAAIGWLVSR